MSKLENSIGWCDDTGNKVIGCAKVSEGCKNCYAEVGTAARVMRHRYVDPVETWGPTGKRIPVADFTTKLRRLNKLCICDRCHETAPYDQAIGARHYEKDKPPCVGLFRRIRLFADSNSDWLDEAWPIEDLLEFLDDIRLAPNVDVLLLTKRINRIETVLRLCSRAKTKPHLQDWLVEWVNGNPPPNVWLGVSVENQKRADERIPILLETPAAVRFLSVEPLLSPVDPFSGVRPSPAAAARIQWVIVGGESGKDRRDCGVEAICAVAMQCVEFSVPVYVKQDCAFQSGQQGRIPDVVWRLKQFPRTDHSALRTPHSALASAE